MPFFCKSCQENKVNTRIEIRDNPNTGKRQGFDVDKQAWHNCPYWKPDPDYKKKQEAKTISQQEAEINKWKSEQPAGQLTLNTSPSAADTNIQDLATRIGDTDQHVIALLTYIKTLTDTTYGADVTDRVSILAEENAQLKIALKLLQKEKGFQNAAGVK